MLLLHCVLCGASDVAVALHAVRCLGCCCCPACCAAPRMLLLPCVLCGASDVAVAEMGNASAAATAAAAADAGVAPARLDPVLPSPIWPRACRPASQPVLPPDVALCRCAPLWHARSSTAEVFDTQGNKLAVAELAKGKTVVGLLRHLGCALCWRQAANLAALKPRFEVRTLRRPARARGVHAVPAAEAFGSHAVLQHTVT
eukprot:366462-Chlamydomonas_euryale.AAC.22